MRAREDWVRGGRQTAAARQNKDAIEAVLKSFRPVAAPQAARTGWLAKAANAVSRFVQRRRA